MKQLSSVEIGRMHQFADFLETVPPEDFDLTLWVERQQRDPKSLLFGLIQRDPGCGFAGCAMGWAAYSEVFPGLRLTRDAKDVTFAGFTGYDAAAALLGVGDNQAFFFFAPSSYEDAEPGHVAARLRKFAAKVERRINRQQRPGLRVVA